MGFTEEKKENDGVHDNVDNNYEDDTKKPHEKMLDTYEMEENEGEDHDEPNQGQQQGEDQQGNSQVIDLTGVQVQHQKQQQQPQQQHAPGLMNMNHVSHNVLDQATQAAQQLLAQSQTPNNQQQLQQYAQQPAISLDAATLSALPQQTLSYLTQQPANSLPGINLLVQNAVQNQQAVAQAQVSALIGAAGLSPNNVVQTTQGFVNSPVPSVVSNGFSFGQQQQQQTQNQQIQLQQQLVASSGSSISSANLPYPTFTHAPTVALTPTNQITPITMPIIPSFTTPSILGPNSLTLSPQLTIPHYIPPTPASWGAPLPTLTVQDRPLVPPIYNGINPNYPKAQMLNAHPPIFCVYDFLTPAECDFLIEAASDAFGPAPVVGKGQGEVSPSRTSSTCYLAREDLPEYLRKVSLLTGKPAEHCELPQVGRYLPSQQYLQHFDAFDLSNEDGRRFAQNGGQRTITVLTYLNDVGLGGATAFPNLNLQVQPRRGMALVFFPSTLDGLLDKMALHAALPAVDVKYVSQVWIRQTNYDGRPSKRLPKPMVAGLQEQRDREEMERSVQAQILMGQFGLHQASANQQQQGS